MIRLPLYSVYHGMYSSSRSDPVRATLSQIVLCCTVITSIDNDTGCLSVLISVSNLVSALLIIFSTHPSLTTKYIRDLLPRTHLHYPLHLLGFLYPTIEISAFS